MSLLRAISTLGSIWSLCSSHHHLWLACAYLSGTLCLLNPVLIVGESIKVARILQEDYLVSVYERVPSPTTFQHFLSGEFGFEELRAMFKTAAFERDFEHLALPALEWLQVSGVPRIIRYSP